MKLFTKSVAAALIGAALILIGSGVQAKAGSVAYSSTLSSVNFLTLSGSSVSLQAFDSSFGTLQSVTVTLSGTLTSSSVTISTVSGNTVAKSSTVSTDVAVTLSNAGGSISSIDLSTATASPVSTIPQNSSATIPTGTATDSTQTQIYTGLTSWEKTGDSSTVSLTLDGVTVVYNTLTQSQTNGGASVSPTSATGDVVVTVTYNYTPTAVPEPTTWAMLFGGVGTLVLVQQLRRRSHA